MLSGHDNPFKPIDMDAYYLGHCDFPDITGDRLPKLTEVPEDKNEQVSHLRRVQSTNFLGRAAIRLADLFSRH